MANSKAPLLLDKNIVDILFNLSGRNVNIFDEYIPKEWEGIGGKPVGVPPKSKENPK